ncbi:MAG: hypothetical protein QW080_05220 [Sulfolobales archaeon]
MLRALGVIKSSRVCKPMSTYRCFGDPRLPRPTADRGEGTQGNRDDPLQEDIQKPRVGNG